MFVTVNRTDLKGRREANIVAVRALFADLDGAPLSVLERLGLLPHIIAMTSPSRFHAYWRVDGVETAEFAGLQKRLAALMGSDPSVCDLPRVMRLPGFPHQKDPAEPHLVWFRAREHSGPYEADAFRAALAAAERNGVADKGLIGERRPEPRQGRTNGNRAAFPDIHAPAPEPWSEIGERRLRSALKAIPAFDRDTWLKIGFALHDLAAADPRWPSRPMWDEWSRTYPKKFNEADQDKTWASFAGRDYSGQRAGIATIYHLAKQHGWRDPTAPTADCHASDRKELLRAQEILLKGGLGNVCQSRRRRLRASLLCRLSNTIACALLRPKSSAFVSERWTKRCCDTVLKTMTHAPRVGPCLSPHLNLGPTQSMGPP